MKKKDKEEEKKSARRRISEAHREIISRIVNAELAELPELLLQLDARERVSSVIQLCKYVVPTLQSVELDDKSESHNRLASALEDIIADRKSKD